MEQQVNIYEWDAAALRKRRDSLLSANQTFHQDDGALDVLVERWSMSIEDMLILAASIYRLELFSQLMKG